MAKKFKTKFTTKEMYDYFISDSLTVAQTKALIRSFTEKVNKIPRNLESMQMESLREEIIEYTGVNKYIRVRGRKKEIVGYGFAGKTKSQLQEQLSMLQSYIREYYDTYTSKKHEDDGETERGSKAWKTFCDNYGYVSYKFFLKAVHAMSTVADIIEYFGSKTIASMMVDFQKSMEPIRIAELARRVWVRSESATPRELADDLLDAVLDELSS